MERWHGCQTPDMSCLFRYFPCHKPASMGQGRGGRRYQEAGILIFSRTLPSLRGKSLRICQDLRSSCFPIGLFQQCNTITVRFYARQRSRQKWVNTLTKIGIQTALDFFVHNLFFTFTSGFFRRIYFLYSRWRYPKINLPNVYIWLACSSGENHGNILSKLMLM